jgi:lysophosphatidylcholine acyltransferase/lyso-PAF acetyltransferase
MVKGSTLSSASSSFASSSNGDSTTTTKWPPFNPFVRHPTSRMGILWMMLFGGVLVPIRLVGTLLTLMCGWIWATIALIGLTEEQQLLPYSPRRHWWIFTGFRILARILLFFYGYVWIQTVHPPPPSNDKNNTRPVLPKAVVCNHTGFVEMLYLASAYGCCFVSKVENKHLPFIGKICIAMKCIFVERTKDKTKKTTTTTTSNTTNTSQKIKQRLEAPPGQWPLLALAPEGTTTTGHVVIHFHTGAFHPGQPVRPVAVQMPFSTTMWGYDPTFSCANMNLHILGLMAQPCNFLTVYPLQVYDPSPTEKGNPQLFANNVRQQIANVLEIPVCELQWRDKLLYEPSAKSRALGRKLLLQSTPGSSAEFSSAAAESSSVSVSSSDGGGGGFQGAPVFTQDAFGNRLLAATSKKEQ